ncbi:hypothetical protein ACQPZX_13895 [Actinoplanes sp. CA-142083]|uniref:hypothetical protein n=1 Tax=Actinoplanes sp. CA-142083 TaxID=3239903 RepID=UPI003D8E4D7A
MLRWRRLTTRPAWRSTVACWLAPPGEIPSRLLEQRRVRQPRRRLDPLGAGWSEDDLAAAVILVLRPDRWIAWADWD